MVVTNNRRPSEWPRLFAIACNLIDQVSDRTGGYQFEWSFGGGTAMMIQIGHRESHDVDIFFDDGQLLGFLDPAKTDLHFVEAPAGYDGDGARFQKFAFDIGEIDFIVAGPLTRSPFERRDVAGRPVNLETVPEIIAKKIFHRGGEAQARDVFDLAAAAQTHRHEIVEVLREFRPQVIKTRRRLDTLKPDFVSSTIGQLMILPGFADVAQHSLDLATSVLDEVLDT